MSVERSAQPALGRALDGVALKRTRKRLLAQAAVPWLHAEAARRMAERLPVIKLQPSAVLDWSGPLGASAELLRNAYPSARQLAVMPDESAAAAVERRPWWDLRRLGEARREIVGEQGVRPGSAQLLWSNMLLHACEDPPALIGRWQQALDVGGFLMFSALGPGTLTELTALHRARGWGDALAPFVDMHDLGDMLVQAGFADPVMDQEQLTLTWPDAEALLRELRGLGANLSPQRHRGLRTPRWRQRLVDALSECSVGGRPALTFEIVYGHAFRAPPRLPVQPQTRVALDDMRALLRKPKA